MTLTRIGQVWEITNPLSQQYGDKFIIVGRPIALNEHVMKYIEDISFEDQVMVEFEYINGSRGAGSLRWVRHECTLLDNQSSTIK